ncbi:unnamed protein product [Toxocara canis]|uniref:SSD domain-containing protein n=1 Tax=Toxocara canis TaxID=6265 RepID=A0A183UL36_TOXCA|nr:unnamed protein product [Toxocara canis]
MNMFGVQTADRMFANHSRITHVATVVLWYFSQVHFPETKRLLEETIIALFEMSKAKNASALIQFDIFGDQIANKEMLRGALQATKLMIIGFFLLLAFVFAVVWQKVHWHRSLPRIALAAVLSPFLAAVIAFGVLAMFRFPFYSIMCVTPFLILGIGVDDAFIMLQSWTHYRMVSCKKERLSKVFVEIGPSISITSITNMIAFGIGYLTPTPQPAKAFPSDSPLANSLEGLRAVSNEFSPLQIIVNNPPNISNKTEQIKFKKKPLQYDNFYEMVSSLESVRFSYGRERTVLFLKAYEKFDRTTFEFLNAFGFTGETQYSPSYDNLPFFLNQIHNPPNIKVTRDQKGVTKLVAFQMTIIAHNMSEWSSRAIYLDECRSVLLRYPQFNATIFDWDSAVLDLILTVKTDLIGSIAVTVLCMAIVCLFFVSSRTGVLVVTFTISSTCFTLVGALSWWGADMDPVTMVDVLIATGFSVDFTAHIAYKFYKGQGTSAQRIEQSFNEMCEPMMQAGTSTALCMLPLIFVPTYAILAFAKTIFLVVSLGLLHGIFLLPILLVTVSSKADVDELPQKGNLDDLERRKEPLLL